MDDSSAQGLQIDAFDADKGEFVLDDFVDVEPDRIPPGRASAWISQQD
jgi:hypothetical protein